MNHLLGVLPLAQVVEVVAAAVMVEEVVAAVVVAAVVVAAAYGAVNRYAADFVHMVPLAT